MSGSVICNKETSLLLTTPIHMGLVHMELLITNNSWLNAEISKLEVD